MIRSSEKSHHMRGQHCPGLTLRRSTVSPLSGGRITATIGHLSVHVGWAAHGVTVGWWSAIGHLRRRVATTITTSSTTKSAPRSVIRSLVYSDGSAVESVDGIYINI